MLGFNVLVGSRVKSLVHANNSFVSVATGTTQKITRPSTVARDAG